MSQSNIILDRLTALHPKVIDLSLGRMERLLAALDHPEDKLPPVIHVAGTNGKGSVIANLQSIMEAAGKSVHSDISPHVQLFAERIRLGAPNGGSLISDDELIRVLEACEEANGGQAITFFEITTAAALLAFSEHEADYLLLEVGLGGRLDATNVIAKPALSIITAVDLDHQSFLGETIDEIAFEKAGILKRGVPAIIGPQAHDKALNVIERQVRAIGAQAYVAGQHWQAYEEHGRLVFQDDDGLLDLPLPRLMGRHQIDNAGIAIAALHNLNDPEITIQHIEKGLSATKWPARLERLGPGALYAIAPEGCELWLDGGHNPAAGRVLAASLADIEDRVSRPLVLIIGMLNNKDAGEFLKPFKGLAARIITLKIPDEPNAYSAEELARIASGLGFAAEPATSLYEALGSLKSHYPHAPRIAICGSLHLAGHVLNAHANEPNKMAGE